ncbi:LacI family DNA-binding transcriptional regulator [Devosia sp. XJ19-1]|uniref:LacI family DNA-binding transcriptional regulator n=1 Tax=Devosia ureilytica TaxID=2952754 RepID=A0A9Q4FRQ9_9HYPH|nr:LacI family DNA-binding transcriptional regulator [Devosia ureilytica]MCP8883184.1 LacI family DNA-binding transcriptional regulator [Devosia ureilytica]MCP8886448.1 LacI family DNA-binding transcriptional regulator [Devosia ureilytica]
MMDVAAAAGVSQATVSLVLNGSKMARLSDATRRRVTEAAERLGYKFVRRGQRTATPGKSTILFIADEVSTDPWMTLAFEGARDKALEFGVNAVMAVSHGDAEFETGILANLREQSILGIIYGTILTRRVGLPPAFAAHRTVLVNCYDEAGNLPAVLPADLLGARVATEHLIGLGRRRIGLINGQQGLDNPRDRLKGYKQALTTHDLAFDAALVKPGNWEPSSGFEMTMELMALPEPPDAIFCANDLMAMGCMEALKQLGRRIPEDVAVIGFDDREIARFLHPPLTTLVLPQYEMGQTAAELLLDSASGLEARTTRIKVECELIVRGSTRPASMDAGQVAAQ